MKVLLSIKPEFVEQIINGNKKFEYRKTIFRRKDISSIIVYATKPYGKVVGEFEIENIMVDEPEAIWKKTKEHSGISSEYFYDYFEGKDVGYAIQIKRFIEYTSPVDLKSFDSSLKAAPQSFCYVD